LEAGRESQSREEDGGVNPEQQQRQTQREPLPQQQQFMALKDKKWSLTEAILLHGTLHQVQQFVHIHHRNATDIVNASPDSFDFYDTSSKNNYADANADEWTQSTHEIERHHLHKKLDASTRSSTQKLYVAFTLLSHASQTLQLGTVVLRRATEGLIQFAERRDGLRVKGVSIGGNAVAKLLAEKDAVITLTSMPWYHVGGPSSSSTSTSKSSQTSTPSSIATDLQRIRQYTSLDAAILYLSAKHAGLGRTLAEVCSAFGTFGTVRRGNTTSALAEGVQDAEPLVRPKHCSKAMQELRAVVPEMVVPPRANASANGAVFNTSSLSSSLDGALGAAPVPVEMESNGSKEGMNDNDDGKPEAVASASSQSIAFADAIKSESTSSPAVDVKREPTPPTTFPDIPTSSSSCNDINNTGSSGSDSKGTMTSINNTEVAALSDLTARMARSLQLPATATTAAVVVAVRCARDAATSQASLFGSSSTASRNGVGSTGTSSTVRRRANKRSYSALRRGGKNGMFAERNGGKNGHPPGGAKLQDTPETIAISSLLLVCMAGGTMQRLARQAVDKRNTELANDDNIDAIHSLENGAGEISHALEDLEHDVFSSDNALSSEVTPATVKSAIASPKNTTAAAANNDITSDKDVFASWDAWNNQPSWHRDLYQMEQRTGISRKTIISYYSSVIHPRRAYFLGVVKHAFEQGDHSECLLRNIAVASPLLTLRGL